jgi:hypothetical protein
MAKATSGTRRKVVEVPKKKATAAQLANLSKGRTKGMAIMDRAIEIQQKGGKRTKTQEVYKIPMKFAMKMAKKTA